MLFCGVDVLTIIILTGHQVFIVYQFHRKLNDCIRNTAAVCPELPANLGYNYVCANSGRLHVRVELFMRIGAPHH